MAKKIVTSNALSNNPEASNHKLLYQDAALLTELFKRSFQHYEVQPFALQHLFIELLMLLVENMENCFLHNDPLPLDYEMHRSFFHHVIQKQSWRHEEVLPSLCNALAYLTQYGVDCFEKQGYPENYETFLNHLRIIFDNPEIILAGKRSVVLLLLAELKDKAGY